MSAHLQRIADLGVVVFVVSSMLAAGMSQPFSAVIAPLTKLRPVLLALLVNFLLAPLVALALSRLIPLQPAHAVGLVLLAGAAGAPFLPKLAEINGGDVAYSVALTILLMLGSILFMPWALPLLVPGLAADAWSIARPLLLLMLAPLVVGFVLARGRREWVGRLAAVVRRISNAAFVLILVLLIGVHFGTIAGTLGSFAIGTYAVFVLVMIGVGHLLGPKDGSTQRVFALAAGNRNVPAALVIAKSSFDDPAVIVMLIVAAVVGLLVLILVARASRRTDWP